MNTAGCWSMMRNRLAALSARKPMLKPLLIAMVLSSAHTALADTLTAVCEGPKGHAVGTEGSLYNNKPVDQPDGMRNAKVTIVWDVGQREAQLLVGGPGREFNEPETLLHMQTSKESVSFLITYPAAVWLYSLYPQPKRLLITQHTNGYASDRGGAIAKAMVAACDMTRK